MTTPTPPTIRLCPRCDSLARPDAKFCAMCGLSLTPGVNNTLAPGTIAHPHPSPTPENHEPVADATNLHYRTESAWGGQRLLGTENIGVVIHNTGYPLRNVILRIRGFDDKKTEIFSVDSEMKRLETDEPTTTEVASYDIPSAPEGITVSLVSADFAPFDEPSAR